MTASTAQTFLARARHVTFRLDRDATTEEIRAAVTASAASSWDLAELFLER